MGLTFQQKFYQVPEEVYLVQFLDGGDWESNHVVYAIIEKPEDEEEDLNLNILMESKGYALQSCNFNKLICKGFNLLKELRDDIYDD